MKTNKKGLISLIIQSAVALLLMAVLIVGTCVAYYFDTEINTVLAPPIVDKAAMEVASAAGQKLSAQIVEEGSVLVRNEDNCLPLSMDEQPKVNVFGWHSIDWLYGTGGGSVSSGGVLPENDDFSENIDLYKALNEYGVEYNSALYDMYYSYKSPYNLGRSLKSGDFIEAMSLVEPSITDKKYYSDTILNNAKNYSNTAIMVISRLCGENSSCPTSGHTAADKSGSWFDESTHFLEITNRERELLTYLGENFEKVIVLINTCNQFELGFLETIPNIDACLLVGYTGTRGAVSIPKLLYGEVSPSARTTDVYAYDLHTTPSNIWGATTYKDKWWEWFEDQISNIYIGYKWYETADVMGLWSSENGYDKGYEGVVQYPFGYGLSYTTFEKTVDDVKIDGVSAQNGAALKENSKIEFTVTVKNTGEYAGKEVIEIFGTAPYTLGGIEKSAVEFVGYGKTNVIEPNASETVTVTVDMYDIASYDCYDKNNDGIKGYQLDKGDYSFKIQSDSHRVSPVTYNGETIEGVFTFNLSETKHIANDPVTGQPVNNLFTGEDAIDIIPIDAKTETFDPEIPWLSRADFPTPQELKDLFANYKNVRKKTTEIFDYDEKSYARWAEWDKQTVDAFGNPVSWEKPVWGASGDKKIAVNGVITDLGKQLGANYDDPAWDELLNQITFQEAFDEINRYYGSKEINSVGKPFLADLDGPTQIRGYSTAPRGTGYPAMPVLAQTWNQELAYKFGQSFGDDMKAVGVMGLWGFACDLHIRSFFGRNNESPSEDPFLAGTTIANAVKGVNTRGRYTFIKHFAIYDGSATHQLFTTEQSLRETNLKAYRKLIVDGGALGLMTSYEAVGAELSNYSEALIQGVVRREWQFKGSITTDASGGQDHIIEGLIRCGGNFGMNVALGVTGMKYSEAETAPRMQNAMREAMHQVLYTYLRADYNKTVYETTASESGTFISSTSINSWVWWKPFLLSLDSVVGCLVLFWLICSVTGFIEKSKTTKEDEQNA